MEFWIMFLKIIWQWTQHNTHTHALALVHKHSKISIFLPSKYIPFKLAAMPNNVIKLAEINCGYNYSCWLLAYLYEDMDICIICIWHAQNTRAQEIHLNRLEKKNTSLKCLWLFLNLHWLTLLYEISKNFNSSKFLHEN